MNIQKRDRDTIFAMEMQSVALMSLVQDIDDVWGNQSCQSCSERYPEHIMSNQKAKMQLNHVINSKKLQNSPYQLRASQPPAVVRSGGA